jgi:50S ribosomal subunit-associated GTPase HflX
MKNVTTVCVLNRELEEVFGVPVYDRYMVVIQIFREHAVSKEAKLQIAMAEIPYLRYVCNCIKIVYCLSNCH